MGDYYGNPFPFEIATLSYLDSAFKDYGTFTKEEVEQIGWRYGEEKEAETGESESVTKLPDDIDNLKENKLDTAFLCERSKKPFKIIEQEIRLLKKIQAPLPHFFHEIRYEDRVKFRRSNNV